MAKVKIGFEINHAWNLQIFRDFLEKLKQVEEVELYLISSQTNEKIVNRVLEFLNIPESRYYKYTTYQDKVIAIDFFDLNIYLDDDSEDYLKLRNASIIAYPVYANYKIDKYYLTQRFIIETNDYIKLVKKELGLC